MPIESRGSLDPMGEAPTFDKPYKMTERRDFPGGILPNEVWFKILEFLCPKPGELVKPEARHGLSEESFAPGLPSQPDKNSQEYDDLVNFMKSCQMLARIGRSRLFMRISTRLRAQEDFQRLEYIADQVSMAEHVQQFSYMIPRFYAYPEGLSLPDFEVIRETAVGETAAAQLQLDKLLGAHHPSSSSSSSPSLTDRQLSQLPHFQKRLRNCQKMQEHIDTIIEKATKQTQIISERIDVKCLLHAFQRFPKLQQIRLMPFIETADLGWERYLDTHQALAARLRPSLHDSFRHGARTLTSALLNSGNNASRFSCRSMDLGTIVLPPTDPLLITMRRIAERLTRLDLQFVYRDIDIDNKLHALSELFLLLFQAAIHLKSLHVGFGKRVSIPLQLVFHDVQFPSLQHLGIHEWHLHSEELMELLGRYRHSLRSVRLRHVSLKEETPAENGKWERVLKFIRLNLKLEWISLRWISYNEHLVLGGMQFANMIYGPPPDTDGDSDISDDFDAEGESDPEDPEGTWSVSNASSESSDSGDEGEQRQQNGIQEAGLLLGGSHDADPDMDEDDNHSDRSEDTMIGGQTQDSLEDSTDESNDEQDDGMSDLDDMHNIPHVESPNMNSTGRPPFVAGSSCHCMEGFSWDQHPRDNGFQVTRLQWKKWEKWVLKRCQRGHDPRPEDAT